MPEEKSATASAWAEPCDAPELTDEWFSTADLCEAAKLIRCGSRLKKAAPKEAVSMRLDRQSRINAALRKAAGQQGNGPG